MQTDLATLEEWYQDPKLHRVGGPAAPRLFLKLMRFNFNRYCWMIRKHNEDVGFVDLEIKPNERVAWIALLIKPMLQNQGLGKQILQALMKVPELSEVDKLRAGIEEDNESSLRCFKAVGFEQMDSDEKGIVNLQYIDCGRKRVT